MVGLAAEASLLSSLHCPVVIGGGGIVGAAEAVRRALSEGAEALISCGLAGGLDPDLAAGALIIPRFVRVGGESLAADPALVAALGGATQQVLLAGDVIAGSAVAKQALWRRTGAAAVDLESGAVAALAVEHGVPFAVLRVVCDPAGRDLPPAALLPLVAGGRVPLAAVLGSVLRQPGQVGSLMALGRDVAAARRTLAARVALLPWQVPRR